MSDVLRPEPDPRVVHRDLATGDGALLLHLDSGEYHGINATGSAIWKLIDGKRTVDEIAAALRAAVDDPPEGLLEEVRRFVSDLRARRLLLP